jgi:GINS complex subunit 3
MMLAVSANLSTESLVNLDMPESLSPRVLNALKAGPETVDMRAQAPNFYGLAVRMLELYEEEEWIDVLTDTFKKRAMRIADQAGNARGAVGGEGADFMRGLDESERLCESCLLYSAIEQLSIYRYEKYV